MNLPTKRTIRLLTALPAFALCVLMGSLVAPQDAEASSLRISCGVYASNHEDPIRQADHLHNQFANTSTNDASTYESLRASPDTSCNNAPYLTSAGWYPQERYEESNTSILYYRDPANAGDAPARALPEGVQMVAASQGVTYNCGAEPLNATESQATPPYGCTQNWATHVRMPACWDGTRLTPDGVVYGPSRQTCPASHPVRLLEVNFTITHKNLDGKVPNPLRVSSGVNQWSPYTAMHADYFFAAQDEVNLDQDKDGDGRVEPFDSDSDGAYEPWAPGGDAEQSLVELCVNEAPKSLAYANSRCRADGLLAPHVRALRAQYEGKAVPTDQ